MDFKFTEEQTMVRDLARGILDKEVSLERTMAVLNGPAEYDDALWATLAEAGLVGLAVDESQGGMGLGFDALCTFVEEIGRAIPSIPALPTIVFGAMPINQFGTDAQREAVLPSVVSGQGHLTAALTDSGSSDPLSPATTATKTSNGWELNGSKSLVPAAGVAGHVLIPARTDDGIGVFIVPAGTPGMTLEGSLVTTGEQWFDITLDGAVVADTMLLGGAVDAQAEKLQWIYERALVAIASMQFGLSDRALRMTTAYVAERIQFGVPIGSFQSVQHRSADCYIDLESLRWVTCRAAWKLTNDQPAARDAAIAKIWAADAGSRVANAAQHLHGGMGADTDCPIHRYFLWSKALELQLGNAAQQLDWLGRDMARTGYQEAI